MISPARTSAFDILLRVDREQAYAGELLHSVRLDDLSTADRALCMEIVMGVLRWRSRLDADIARLSFTPFRKLDLEVLTALRIGAYQIEFLERIPARAAVNESVDLVKRAGKTSAAPLTNAVLRKLPRPERRRAVEMRHAASLHEQFAHPQWLVERWTGTYGAEAAAAICAYDQQVPPTAIRIAQGHDPAAVEGELQADGIGFAPGALLTSARRVISGDVTRSAAFRERRIRVQDEGSQLVAALLGHGERVLDCCAAPGGKTAMIADRNPGAQVLAVDLHPHRARLLRELVEDKRISVLAADARALPLRGDFDRVLVDVPCSGTGTLARNPEIKWRLKPEDLADLHARQLAILHAALDQLAPGGRLVYSTCSLEPEECEAVVHESGARVLPLIDELEKLRSTGELAAAPEAMTRGEFLRTVPGVQPCDGFFAAMLGA